MNVTLYTSYAGLCAKDGERFPASALQNDYFCFEITVDHTMITGATTNTGRLVEVMMYKE